MPPLPGRPGSAWVSAQWKNRVPEPGDAAHAGDAGASPQAGYLRYLLDQYLHSKAS